MRLHSVLLSSAHIGEEYLVDDFLFGRLVFTVEFTQSILHCGCLHFAATDIEQEVLVNGLALTRVKLVESTGQTTWLVRAFAIRRAFCILGALVKLGRLGDS